MKELAVLAGPLLVILLLLAWPPDPPKPPRHRADNTRNTSSIRPREPQRSSSGAAEHHPATPKSPRKPHPETAHSWIAADNEARWHLQSHHSPAAQCGHRPRGPARKHPHPSPPTDPRRAICQACCFTAELPAESHHRPAARPVRSRCAAASAVQR